MNIKLTQPIKVTLVEDNLALLEELLYQLMLVGFNARGVQNAEDLDALMQEWQSDIYVLDINLPGENGFSIAKGTSEKLPFCATVILKSGRKFQYLAIFSSKQPVFLENKPFFRLIFKFQTQSGVDVHKHPLE